MVLLEKYFSHLHHNKPLTGGTMKHLPKIILTLTVLFAGLLIVWLFNTGLVADPVETPNFSSSDVFEVKVCQNTEGKNSVELKSQEYAFHEIGWGEKIVATNRGFSFLSDMGPFGVEANEIFSLSAESSVVDSEINQLDGVWMVNFVIQDLYITATFFDSGNYGKTFTLYPNECITVTSNTISVPFDVQTNP